MYHGVSYLTDAEEEEFEKETQEKLNNTMPDIPIDYNEVEFMDNVRYGRIKLPMLCVTSELMPLS